MRFAVPMADGMLAVHFGHCERFALVDVDASSKGIAGIDTVEAPEHQPGLLPPWLASQAVNVVIAGGMGQRAQSLFTAQGIQVILGAPVDTPENLVRAFLDGTLVTGENVCDH